jgi:hypothetical protein
MSSNFPARRPAFRDEVRAFIAENYPADMRVPILETDLSKELMLLWHRIPHQKGWIAPMAFGSLGEGESMDLTGFQT